MSSDTRPEFLALHKAITTRDREQRAVGIEECAQRVSDERDVHEHDSGHTEDECKAVVMALESLEMKLRHFAQQVRRGD